MQVKKKELAFWKFGGFGEKRAAPGGVFRYFAGEKLNDFKRIRLAALKSSSFSMNPLKKHGNSRGGGNRGRGRARPEREAGSCPERARKMGKGETAFF